MKKNAARRRQKRRAKIAVGAVAGVLAVGALGTVLYFTVLKGVIAGKNNKIVVTDINGSEVSYEPEELQQQLDVPTFYEGVTINGVSVAGKTKEEVKAQFASEINKPAAEVVDVKFQVGNDLIPMGTEGMTISSDIEDIIEQAYGYGRTSTLPGDEGLKDRYNTINRLKTSPMDFVSTYTLDTSAVDSLTHQALDSLEKEVVEAHATGYIKRLGTAFLVVVIVIEIVVFNPRCFMPEVYAGMQDAPNFQKMLTNIGDLSDQIEDQDWYRTDLHQTWHYLICDNNLPFYTGKPGMSIFASMANKKTNRFLKQLGYNSNYNYFSLQHDNVILPADAILGVRYIITEEEGKLELTDVAQVEDFHLYRNEYTLQAAMLVPQEAASFDGYALEKDEDKKDYFDFQEKWIASLSGIDASDIYETWTPKWEVLNGQKIDVAPEEYITKADTLENTLNLETKDLTSESLNFYLRNNDKAPMVLRTTFKTDRDGAVYFSIPFLHLQCRGDVYINGEKVYSLDSSSFYSRILDLGNYKKGEEVKLEIRSGHPDPE